MTIPADIAREVLALERYIAENGPPVPQLAPWCPHTPHARQQAFLDLRDVFEVGYGGAAAGGKTDAGIMGALEYVHVPGYAAKLFRRTHPELIGANGLIPRLLEWLQPHINDGSVVWRASEQQIVFPSGARILFGHMQHEADWMKQMGDELQYVFFDELTSFAEIQYNKLLTRLRRPKTGPLSKVPLRARWGSNPGGPGHVWVGKRWGIREDGTQDVAAATNPETNVARIFVPARLTDNEANVDRESYERTFTNVDSITRAQQERGQWVLDSVGLVYKGFNRKRNCVSRFPHAGQPGWTHNVLSIDLGASQATPSTAFAVLTYSDHDPRVYVRRSWAEAGLDPTSDAERIEATAEDFNGLERVVVDLGGLGGGYASEFSRRFGEMIVAAQKKDKLGFRRLLNGALERGHLILVEPENEPLITELETLQWNEAGTDVATGVADHLSDALLYGWRDCYGFAAEATASRPAHGTPEWSAEEERRMEDALDAQLQRSAERAWYEDGED